MNVLLATFNGEKYLEEQLQSLAQQEEIDVKVWANDDGSGDATQAILLKWKSKGLIKGISETQKIGSTRAFLKLLSEHSESEYVAFSDQDDIWDIKKLVLQVAKLADDIPMLVSSQRLYIDGNGRTIGKSRKLKKSPSFENAMVENIAPGNTILLNNRSIRLINEFPNPMIKHYDSWIYLLVTAFGKVEFLQQPLVKYRIHKDNAVGLRKLDFRRFERSVVDFLEQAKFLSGISGHDLPQEKKKLLKELISLFEDGSKLQRGSALLKLSVKRQSEVDLLGLKILLLLLILRPKF